MAEWIECSIGDLCNTISDTYKGNDEYVVLVNTSDVLEGKVLNHEAVANKNLKGQFKKTFKRDDILYSEIRPANKRFAYIDFENTSNYIASTKLMVLRHNDKILPEYLFVLLKSNYVIAELQHLAETRSGTFPQITFSSELAPMKVFLPDKDTQKRIVSILSSIEQKIDKNTEINNNLYEQMLAIFDNAKRTSSWHAHKLGDVLTFFDNLRKPLSSIQRAKMTHIYPYYGATSVVDYVEDYLFDGTYILISEDGANVVDASGHPLTQYTYGKFWVNNHAHIVKGTNNYSNALIYAILGTLNMQSIVTGAAQPKINQANLRNFETALPENEEAQTLSSVLNPMFKQMIHHDQENEKLSALRDTLLPQLMSGELDVSDIDL